MMSKILLDSAELNKAVKQMAKEIHKSVKDYKNLAIVGIHSNGVFIAKKILQELKTVTGFDIPFGTLDITLYRDDIDNLSSGEREIKDTEIPFDLEISKKNIILVDDVLYTGRTIRAALDFLMSFGRPQSIKLAVFVDRGGRELPIEPNFTGIKFHAGKKIKVECSQKDGEGRVVILD
ncbi:MAG: bifunctional pyr operon transcriptional regulator/uracil phosphoribosyltransferase PyrR [Elusimicrobiota bacterium]|jgi:pyrimidine operon attenuation protein/uracil phosphoribosyltransferase|nr:bifunctional pyr operon transcriptional regulator/uracil phosphoribosyltransferase PyrR [Elusimicrobiota bacterium]